MSDEINFVVATVAFGMGINKPDVRFVFHDILPFSVDDYIQMFGRAGRDGRYSESVIFYRPGDISMLKFVINGVKKEKMCDGSGSQDAIDRKLAFVARQV